MEPKNIQDNDRIVEAFEFAYTAHKGICRKKSNIPYIVHPIDVASTLMKNNASENTVIAGLLHDVVEDTEIPLSEIRDRFGDEVATLVDGASEPEELRKVEGSKSKNWHERKNHTIKFISNANHDMKLLSCADKLANIRDIIRDRDRLGEDVWKMFNAPKNSLAWYYTSMVEAFAAGDYNIVNMPAFGEYKKCVEDVYEGTGYVIPSGKIV